MAELRPYAPNMSFALDMRSWSIREWQGLTGKGVRFLHDMAKANLRRYRALLKAEGTVPKCARLLATPDTDARNLESSAHYISALLGLDKSLLTTDMMMLRQATSFGGTIANCANLTRRAPAHSLRQGGAALPGLPVKCATGTERDLANLNPHHGRLAVMHRIQPHLERISRVLGCCAPELCAGGQWRAQAPCSIVDLPVGWSPRWWETYEGPLSVGFYFSELFLLQALNGMAVASGKLSPAEAMADAAPVLSASYALAWNEHNARAHGSALAAYVLQLLRFAATQAEGQRLTYVSSHDVNILYLKHLLGVSWKLAGWPADFPMLGGALAFELIRNAAGDAFVKVAYEAPIAPWLRSSSGPKVERDWLTVPACAKWARAHGCPLARFVSLLADATSPECVADSSLRTLLLDVRPRSATIGDMEGHTKDRSRRYDDRGQPPWVLLLIVQLLGCISDTLLGGAARRSTPRRSLIIRTAVSALQCLAVLSALQLCMPLLTGRQYRGPLEKRCAGVRACPPQGPLSMLSALLAHPLLWLNGLLALTYHVAEIALLRNPWGVLLKPIASLGATFIIEPVSAVLGIADASPPLPAVLVGVMGVFASALEPDAAVRRLKQLRSALVPSVRSSIAFQPLMRRRAADADVATDDDDDTSSTVFSTDKAPSAFAAGGGAAAGASHGTARHEQETLALKAPDPVLSAGAGAVPGHLSLTSPPLGSLATGAMVLVPTIAIAACTALWNVSQRFFNDRYDLNVWGYVAIDQVLAPLYVGPFLALTDAVLPLRARLLAEEDRRERLHDALRSSWDEQMAAWLPTSEGVKVAIGIALANTRVFFYFHMLITYNMSQTFFILTLLRVVSSWLFVVVLANAIPERIGLTAAQIAKMFEPRTISLKLAGSLLIVAALVLLVWLR